MARKSARGMGFMCGAQYSRDSTPQQGMIRSFQPIPSAVTPQFVRRTPCLRFNCLKMGHLRSDCPKLHKTYPLCTLVPDGGNVCMGSANEDEDIAEHKGSMLKIKNGDHCKLQYRGKVYNGDGSIQSCPEVRKLSLILVCVECGRLARRGGST